MNAYNHPVSIITKNSMIERDIDLLTAMVKRRLTTVGVSVTSLSNELKLEPRASTPKP